MTSLHHLPNLVLDELLHENYLNNHRFKLGLNKFVNTLKKLYDLKEEMNIKRGGVNDYHEL